MPETPIQSPAARKPDARGRLATGTLLSLLLLSGVGAGAAFALSPAPLPPLPGEDALGTRAAGALFANADYDVSDPELAEARREEAARAVWPVYDYDPRAGEALRLRLQEAFGQERAALDAWAKAHPVSAAGSRSRAQAERQTYLLSRKDAFLKALQVVLDEDDYLALAKGGFDPAVERAASHLARVLDGEFVVNHRELLAADRERGITVRTLSTRPDRPAEVSPQERKVRDFDRIRDLTQVRAELERSGSDELAELSPAIRHAVLALLKREAQPNLLYDDAETHRREQEQRDAVGDVLIKVRKGQRLLAPGETISRTHLAIFRAMRQAGGSSEWQLVRLAAALCAIVLCGALYAFGRRNVRKFRLRRRDSTLLAVLLVGQLFLVRACLDLASLGSQSFRDRLHEPMGISSTLVMELLLAAVPFAAGPMLIRFLVASEAALIWTAAFACLSALIPGIPQPTGAALILVSGIVAADRVGHAGSWGAVFRAGFWSGVITGLFQLAMGLLLRHPPAQSWAAATGALIGGAALTPLLVFAVAPLCELLFGYVTDIRLHALSSFNHPLLKDLIVQAPGTYHHAIVIGSLVEQAARAIGANPLLSRVGAYYHDLGKGKAPLFFGENQKGDNRHEQLPPHTSAAVIRRHVEDGLEMARKARLPAAVREFIAQHHGTRLIGYFFHRAKEEADRAGQPPPPEAEFRYAGPRPQTREIALVMLADIVVACSRNVKEPTEEKLRAVVEHSIQALVAEGQLEDSDLTLGDLTKISRSFTAALARVYRADLPAGLTPPPRMLRPVATDPSLKASSGL